MCVDSHGCGGLGGGWDVSGGWYSFGMKILGCITSHLGSAPASPECEVITSLSRFTALGRVQP